MWVGVAGRSQGMRLSLTMVKWFIMTPATWRLQLTHPNVSYSCHSTVKPAHPDTSSDTGSTYTRCYRAIQRILLKPFCYIWSFCEKISTASTAYSVKMFWSELFVRRAECWLPGIYIVKSEGFQKCFCNVYFMKGFFVKLPSESKQPLQKSFRLYSSYFVKKKMK